MAAEESTPPPAADDQQLAEYAWCERAPGREFGHDLTVEIRTSRHDGGNPDLIKRRQVFNDTGSNAQSVWVEDWDALKVPGMVFQPGFLASATSGAQCLNVNMEIRIMKRILEHDAQGNQVEHFQPLTHWFLEMCILVPYPQILRSGETMRSLLYFATQPGNDRLLVSRTKQAIIDGLEGRLAADNSK